MIHFVPTPIGNLEDISKRSLKLIESADTIFCEDTRIAKKLISLLADRYSIASNIQKYISLHSHNEKKVLSSIDKSLFEGTVLYMSDAGMPGISDPGAYLVQYAREEDIEYEVLPGANAALLAYVSSGFSGGKFLFFGFLPHKGKERADALKDVLNSGYDTVVYESPHRIKKLIGEIALIDPERELFAIKEATKLHEKTFLFSALMLQDIFEKENLKGEWSVVVKAKKTQTYSLSVEDIKMLDIPKKQAAKLISKITGKSVKDCYNELLWQ